MTQPLKYPIGEQDFAGIREGGKVYIDKTEIIYKLIHGPKYVFLARPRRFGKSLLLSTIKAFFEGKKELFKGLSIYELEKEWTKHPVFHLGWEMFDPNDPKKIDRILSSYISKWEEEWGVAPTEEDLTARFVRLIQHSVNRSGHKAVILIDEYDGPLHSTLLEGPVHEEIRTKLKAFYSIIKNQDQYLHFGMLTGVTRFSRMEVFSGLNNLWDITMDPEYGDICGITEKELITFLHSSTDNLAKAIGKSYEETLKVLKGKYDGYHFTMPSPDIYNPFSLLNTFARNKIGNYWIISGSPSFLLDHIYDHLEDVEKIMNSEADEMMLTEIDTAYTSTLALLFQSGYLTIKDYDEDINAYTLGIPNQEVREGFYFDLLTRCLDRRKDLSGSLLLQINKALKQGNPEEFVKQLKVYFGNISYELSTRLHEAYYQAYIYILCQLIGINAEVERHTSEGRIDIVIQNSKYVYVIELKVDRPVSEAMSQIENRKYDLPWKTDGREVFKIALSFDTKTRNIKDYIVE